MKNSALWQKLQAFAFDADTATQPFSVKLSEAEGWDASYTARVIEEYRRFLYLAQVADHEVTPSVAVDQAWHTHLTFTRAYWDDLCAHVLGAPLHHDPCKGSEDMDRYRDQYDRTRALYVAEFGHSAPEDIWPPLPLDVPETSPPAVPKTLFMWAGIIGAVGLVASLVLMLIFGVSGWTVALLPLSVLLIVFGFVPRKPDRKRTDAGGGVFVGGCSGKGSGDKGSGGADGGAGCGGGGCGGGGG